MIGTNENTTPATLADVRRIVREELESMFTRWRQQLEAEDQPAEGV